MRNKLEMYIEDKLFRIILMIAKIAIWFVEEKTKNMRRKIIYIIVLILVCYVYFCTIKTKVTEKKHIVVKEFGIVTQEDIYVDNMEKGRYTSHGRLILNKQDNEKN
jgi:hypothetical protein